MYHGVHRRPLRHRLGIALALLFTAVSIDAASAHAAEGGLSGVITDDTTHAPLADVRVTVYQMVDDEKETVARSSTDASGAYAFPTLPAGAYHLELSREGYVREYARDQYVPDKATHITVPGTFNEGLAAAAELSGTLLDAQKNAVSSGWVLAMPVNGGSLASSGGSQLGPNGYSIKGLLPGEYRVKFEPSGKNWQWAYGAATREKAAIITLQAGPNTVSDTLLPQPTGILSGVVTDKDAGAPLTGMCVQALADVPPSGPRRVCTGADGRYRFTGLPSETVKLVITDPTSRYVTDGAIAVETTDGQTVTRDIALDRGGRFTGAAVDGATGRPVNAGAVCLHAEPVDGGSSVRGDCPDTDDGRFAIPQLAAGSYKLRLSAIGSEAGGYGEGWVNADGTGTSEESEAGVFRVSLGQDTEVPNVRLDKAGSITGVVTDKDTGKPLAGVCVGINAYSARSETFYGPHGCTDANGLYTINRLGPGGWKVQFVPQGTYGWIWSGGATSRADASKVPVKSGGATTVDMALVRGAATLTGTIELPTGTEYYVDVVNAETGDHAAPGASGPLKNRAGAYKVAGITPQRVKVTFYDPWTGSRHWYGGTSFATAKVVTISPGTTTVDLKATGGGTS
jgi:5-hydroxyisourate hydrolase-like protein (transthyretin family)